MDMIIDTIMYFPTLDIADALTRGDGSCNGQRNNEWKRDIVCESPRVSCVSCAEDGQEDSYYDYGDRQSCCEY